MPDDPSQYYAAEAEHQQRVLRPQQAQAGEPQPSAYDARSDAISRVTRDSRSEAGRETIAADAHSQATRDAEYRASVKRWGRRMAGAPPSGYTDNRVTARGTHNPVVPTPDIPKPPVYTTDCTQNVYTVHCNNSDASESYGNVGPNGNGSVSGDDGSFQQIHRDPYGHSKTSDGTCVKDVYGQCQ